MSNDPAQSGDVAVQSNKTRRRGRKAKQAEDYRKLAESRGFWWQLPNGQELHLKDGQMVMMDGTIMDGGKPKPMMKPQGMDTNE